MYKALALGLLLIASACTKVSDENESDTPRVHWSAEKKALYQSWSNTQCYYEERPFGIFLVNRNDTMQEEFLKTNGMLVEFNIEWQTDSTYTLAFKRFNLYHLPETREKAWTYDGEINLNLA